MTAVIAIHLKKLTSLKTFKDVLQNYKYSKIISREIYTC